MNNNEIRKQKLSLRQEQSREKCKELSDRISDTLSKKLSELCCDKDTNVLSYFSINNEVNLITVNDELIYGGIPVFFPLTRGEDMEFFRVMPGGTFIQGTFHCFEPEDRSVPLNRSERIIALVPGVAFSEKGYRLGYGKGYYDRFLPTCADILRIGVCYELQLSEEIVPSEYDVPMDMIITEKRVISL